AGEPAQRFEFLPVTQPGFEELAVGDVAGMHQTHPNAAVFDVAADGLERAPLSVFPAHAELNERRPVLGRQRRLERRAGLGQTVGMNQVEDAASGPFGRQIAEQALDGRALEQNLAAEIDERDEIDRVVDAYATLTI